MNDITRIQVRENTAEHEWKDVGNKAGDQSVPVSVSSLPLPTGAATAANQLPDNHQVEVSNFPETFPLTTAQLATLSPRKYDYSGDSDFVKKYYTSAGAVTDGIVWSPAAGKRWHITDIFINVSAAAIVTLEDDLAGGDSVVWKAEFAGNSGWSHSFATPLFSGEDAADLLITTNAGNVYVSIMGYEI